MIVTILIGLLVAIFTDEVLGWMKYLSHWLVSRNARRVPLHLQDRCKEEWLAHINEIPGRVCKLLFAVDSYRAAYKISHYYLHPNVSHWVPIVRRVFDISFATIALVLNAPIMLITALLIKLSSKGPVFFAQETIGKDGKVFKLLKFRSMYINNDPKIHQEYVQILINGHNNNGDNKNSFVEGNGFNKITIYPRVTPIGKLLRKTSLCELPQFINVLIGDMSIVGPIPNA